MNDTLMALGCLIGIQDELWELLYRDMETWYLYLWTKRN